VIRVAAYLLLAFLGGALPFGLWIGRMARGVDVRTHGSGNIGATNVMRVAGVGWGLLALALDVAKGWVCVGLLPDPLGVGRVGQGSVWPLFGALAVTGGHVFSPWVGFKGGKGVATFLGAALALAPIAALIAMAGFLVTLAACRYVSVGSGVMATVFPLAELLVGPDAVRGRVALVGVALAVLIAWRHRANWVRLARGEELKLGRKR